ncbi:peptidoglycan editing factor PgeF [Oceanobacillus manasiensis]|uniref:peptidoglycan editing factor PgeF n=1 Tax=Oceanobacillus manasiensis TaxID=586413 RepID=UPI0005A7432A|nr:peptidoglycan editing factor PgeF [Oceanobacillus manasiensis]
MSEPFVRKHASYLSIKKWENLLPSLTVGFSTSVGGFSKPPYQSLNMGLHVQDDQYNVIKNREQLAELLSFPLSNWVGGEQIHGTNIKIVTNDDKGSGATSHTTSLPNIDGIITTEKGILCSAFFADCVPLFFLDPKQQLLGVAHAGWKGTVHGIAEQMINRFRSLGSTASDILVTIGPCISKTHYEVDEQVITHIAEEFHSNSVTAQQNGRYNLDLKQLNKDILLQSGVLRNNIGVSNYCTFEDRELFFSHRRDNGKTGRMLGFIGFSD